MDPEPPEDLVPEFNQKDFETVLSEFETIDSKQDIDYDELKERFKNAGSKEKRMEIL